MSNEKAAEEAVVLHMHLNGWATIDELEEAIEPLLPDDFYEDAKSQARKIWLRRLLRRRTEGGWPEFANIVRQDEQTGEEVHFYKQELMFDIDDYKQVVAYHADRAEYHLKVAFGYKAKAYERFGIQLSLPISWPNDIRQEGSLLDPRSIIHTDA